MRRTILLSAILLGAIFTACQEENIKTFDKEYIMFEDTLNVVPVLDEEDYTIKIPVISSVKCDYERTIAVEVLDIPGTMDSVAVEGRDYTIESNTIRIPAGKYRTDIVIRPNYEMFGDNDTLSFELKLVMPEQLCWDMYGDRTRVSMYKVCPFDINSFKGWCVVTSMFLYSYPGVDDSNASYQRLIKTSLDQANENTVILHDWLFDGYDVKIELDPSDPENPTVTMPEDQLISDEESVFGQMNGDNRILGMSSPAYVSYYNNCQKFVSLWMRAYVYDIKTLVGYVGDFYNIMEWVSDEEAERLQSENGW